MTAPRLTQPRITPRQRALCLRLYAKGLPLRVCAERAAMSYGSAQRYVREAGLSRPHGRPRVTAAECATIVHLYTAGVSWHGIMAHTGKGKQTIIRALDAAGVPRRNVRRRPQAAR